MTVFYWRRIINEKRLRLTFAQYSKKKNTISRVSFLARLESEHRIDCSRSFMHKASFPLCPQVTFTRSSIKPHYRDRVCRAIKINFWTRMNRTDGVDRFNEYALSRRGNELFFPCQPGRSSESHPSRQRWRTQSDYIYNQDKHDRDFWSSFFILSARL